MGWYDSVKSYVWDDRTTPYLVPVERLSQPQADKELFAYTTFLAFVAGAGVIATLALAQTRGNPLFYVPALYCVTIVWCSIYMGLTHDVLAARYCVSAPAVAFLGFVSGVLNANLHLIESVLLGAFSLLWLRYALRVSAIVQAYDSLPPDLPPDLPPVPPSPRRRNPPPPGFKP